MGLKGPMVPSAAFSFDGKAFGFKFHRQLFDMVPLDFDGAVFDRAPRSTALL